MQTNNKLLLLAALSPAALLLSGCSKPGDAQTAVQSTKAAAAGLAADVKATASDSWDTIKEYTYEKHAEFAAGLDRLAAKCDADIAAMNAKLASLPDSAAKDRNQAVKEFNEARAELKTHLSELGDSTADTWAATKAKVVQSWQRVQASFDKVKASPSS